MIINRPNRGVTLKAAGAELRAAIVAPIDAAGLVLGRCPRITASS